MLKQNTCVYLMLNLIQNILMKCLICKNNLDFVFASRYMMGEENDTIGFYIFWNW